MRATVAPMTTDRANATLAQLSGAPPCAAHHSPAARRASAIRCVVAAMPPRRAFGPFSLARRGGVLALSAFLLIDATASHAFAAEAPVGDLPTGALPFEARAALVVLVGLTTLLGLVAAVATIYDKLFRAKPAYHKQFAAIEHAHEEYALRSDCGPRHRGCAQERLDMRQEMGNAVGKVERQIDYLRNTIGAQKDEIMTRLATMDEKQEARSSKIHDRIDPIAAQVAASKQAIAQHLSDERAMQNGGRHGG